MKQYNIYAGLGGSFGGASYQFTTLCETPEQAYEEAYDCACEEYDSYEGLHGLPSWEDAINSYCEDLGIDPEDLEGTSEEDLAIEEFYSAARESWLDYRIVPTDEDDIDQEDLILGYVIEDDSSSQTDSK